MVGNPRGIASDSDSYNLWGTRSFRLCHETYQLWWTNQPCARNKREAQLPPRSESLQCFGWASLHKQFDLVSCDRGGSEGRGTSMDIQHKVKNYWDRLIGVLFYQGFLKNVLMLWSLNAVCVSINLLICNPSFTIFHGGEFSIFIVPIEPWTLLKSSWSSGEKNLSCMTTTLYMHQILSDVFSHTTG